MRRAHGLTLIELLVALAVFAVLGTLSYRGVAQLVDGRVLLGRELERWRALERALGLVETDLLQLAAPQPLAGNPPPLEASPGGGELRFITMSAPQSPRRVGYRVRDERLEWRRWPGRDAGAAPDVDTLLDAVRAARWRFLDAGTWHDRWPPASGAPDRLPAAVELRLDLADIGTVTRLYALR